MKKYILIFVTMALLPISGCRSVVPIAGGSHELQVRLQYDSISRDRVRWRESRGDTIVLHDSVYVDRWRVRVDSVYRSDTITNTLVVPPKDYAFCKGTAIVSFCIMGLALLALLLCIVLRVTRR